MYIYGYYPLAKNLKLDFLRMFFQTFFRVWIRYILVVTFLHENL